MQRFKYGLLLAKTEALAKTVIAIILAIFTHLMYAWNHHHHHHLLTRSPGYSPGAAAPVPENPQKHVRP